MEKVANPHFHKNFGQLFEEATEKLGNLQAGLAKAITPFSLSLPAAKYLDLGIGVDLHSTVAPLPEEEELTDIPLESTAH